MVMLPVGVAPGEHGDLLRGGLSRRSSAQAVQAGSELLTTITNDGVVRPVVGAVSALRDGVDARDRAGPLPGARRQHRHQRRRRSVWPRGARSRLSLSRSGLVEEVRFLTGRTIYTVDRRRGGLTRRWRSSRLALAGRPPSTVRGEPAVSRLRGGTRGSRPRRSGQAAIRRSEPARGRTAEASLRAPASTNSSPRSRSAIGAPDFWSNQAEAQKVMQRRRRARGGLDAAASRCSGAADDLGVLVEWANAGEDVAADLAARPRRAPAGGRSRRDQEDARRRARPRQRHRHHPSRRRRHRVAGLGRDAAAHVPEVVRAPRLQARGDRLPAGRRSRHQERHVARSAATTPSA